MGDEAIIGLTEDSLNKSLYIKRYDRETMRFFHRNECLDWIETLKIIANAPEMRPYCENLKSEEYKGLTLVEICTKLGCCDLVNKIIGLNNDVKNFDLTGIRGNRELILNTHSKIYETLTFEEFERSIKSHE